MSAVPDLPHGGYRVVSTSTRAKLNGVNAICSDHHLSVSCCCDFFLPIICHGVWNLQDPHLRRKALQMFTGRLDPECGGAPRLSRGEESLFVEMVPSLRLVAMGKKSLSIGDDVDEDDAAGEAKLEVVRTRFNKRWSFLFLLHVQA